MTTSVSVTQAPCHHTFGSFSTVSDSYIKNILMNSKPKSCSLDPIPTQLVKQCFDVLTSPITKLINVSLASGKFPTALKKGVVRPSIKKQNIERELYENYRPITNIAFLSKTLERVVFSQLTNYLQENDLLAKFQAAYRCFHSTETALLRVFNDILRAVDNNQEVVLIMLDLSSAFDTIDHTMLVERLHQRYGVCGTALKWFESYLLNRTQTVKIKEVESTNKTLLFGIPQGSVLGPLRFSLFFAPLEDLILAHGLQLMVYADDTHVICELCTKDILIWCTSNGLMCNPSKTETVHFTSRFSSYHELPALIINGFHTQSKPAVRNLGVTMDSHLQLTIHVNNICKSASFAIRNIGRIRKHLEKETCERLVHAFVSSKLDSCNSVLLGLPDREISKLQRIQNTAAIG